MQRPTQKYCLNSQTGTLGVLPSSELAASPRRPLTVFTIVSPRWLNTSSDGGTGKASIASARTIISEICRIFLVTWK